MKCNNVATDSGGGLYNASQVWQNTISGNSALTAGGGLQAKNMTGTTRIANNLITENSVTDLALPNPPGAGLHVAGNTPDILVLHNTFVDNTWNGLVINVIDEVTWLPMRNNILWDSSGLSVSPNTDWDRLQAMSDLEFNVITGAPAKGSDARWNMGDDPLFTNAAGGDFTVQATSPSIDAGGALSPPVLMAYDNASREAVSPDIGAYETTYVATTQGYVYLNVVSDGTGGTPLSLTANLSPSLQALVDGGATLTWQWTFDGVNIAGATASTFTIDPVASTDSGAYRAVATIDAAVHTSAAYTLPTIPVVVYVPDVNDSSDELVINNGFEDPLFGGWTGDIENIWFYDPINNPEGVPRSGNYFLWLGDYATPTTASVTQSVMIPGTGNATLNFYLYTQHASVAYGATDQLEVSLDGIALPGGLIYANDVTYHAGYTLVTIDVSAYADGATHLLKFETIQTGSTLADDTTNFFVDDVSIRTGTDFSGNWGIDLTPSIINFGFVAPGGSATRTVEVINTGASDLVGSAIANDPFFATMNGDYSIPPGGSGTLEITFAPIDSETYHHYIDFTGGGGLKIHAMGNSIEGVVSPSTLNVIINEVSAWNTNGRTDPDEVRSDWIELSKYDAVPVLLDGWKIEYTPAGGTTTTWTFPNGITIGAENFAVVYASNKSVTTSDQGLHTNFTLDETKTGALKLLNPNGATTHQSPVDFPIPAAAGEAWALIDRNFLTSWPKSSSEGLMAAIWRSVSASMATPASYPLATKDDPKEWPLRFEFTSALFLVKSPSDDPILSEGLIQSWIDFGNHALEIDGDGDRQRDAETWANLSLRREDAFFEEDNFGNWHSFNSNQPTWVNSEAALFYVLTNMLANSNVLLLSSITNEFGTKSWGATDARSENRGIALDINIALEPVVSSSGDRRLDHTLLHELGHYSGLLGHPGEKGRPGTPYRLRVMNSGKQIRDLGQLLPGSWISEYDKTFFEGLWKWPSITDVDGYPGLVHRYKP